MYELVKNGVDIIFYVVAAIAIIGVIIRKVNSKKSK